MALILSGISYTILGLIVLSSVPGLRVTFRNLFVFVVGALLGGFVFLFLYGRVFARNRLGDAAFYGIFPVLLVGGVVGGGLLVWLRKRAGN